MPEPTDRQLLLRFASDRDQSAFARLVRRHGPMVLGAARRMAGEDAEDVAQAVFILLAQKAQRLDHLPSVSGWLYRATRYCAANARKVRARRERHLRAHGQQVMQNQSAHAPAGEISHLLDAGLAKLCEHERQAVLLRHIEGLTLEETAAQLGISVASVAKRAQRGLDKLRDHLASRGHFIAPPALAAALASNVETVSESLMGAIMQSTWGTPAPAAVSIASAASWSMTLVKIKIAAAVLLIAGTATTAIVVAQQPAPAPPSAQRPQSEQSPAVAEAPATPLTQDQARAAATAFVTALRDGDELTLRDLIAADTPEARQELAAGYLLEFRSAYARFPDRIASLTNSSFTMSRADELIQAQFSVLPPTEADVRRLVFQLAAINGAWNVTGARFTGELRYSDPDDLQPPPTQPAVPADTWRKAADVYQRMFGRIVSADDAPDDRTAEVVASLRQAPDDIAELAALVKETDLAIDPERAKRISDMFLHACAILETQGRAAFNEWGKNPANQSPQLAQDMGHLMQVGQTATRRADAAEEADRSEPRSLSIEPSRQLILGWDNSTFDLPGPVVLPPWLRNSSRYALWEQQRDLRTFRTRDDAGNFYEVNCMGAAKDEQGTVRPIIPVIRQYRADGTLAATAEFDPRGNVTSWATLDPSGRRYTMRVFCDSEGKVGTVRFFDGQHNIREWTVRDGRIVWLEQLKNPIGTHMRTVHQVNKRDAR